MKPIIAIFMSKNKLNLRELYNSTGLWYYILFFFFISLQPHLLFGGGGFTSIGYSARGIGLGNSLVSLSGQPYSLFYNPSGIYDIKSVGLASTYIKLFPNVENDNLNYYTVSAAIPLHPIGVLGIGATMFKTDMWSENIVYGTYAREIYANFAVGGSLKLLRWSATAAPDESALSYFGVTADAGARYTMEDFIPGNDLAAGVSIRNINQPSIAKNGSDDAKLPMGIDIGLAYTSKTYNYRFITSLEMEDDITKIHLGAEIVASKGKMYGVDYQISFRAGGESITSAGRQGQMNGGIGIELDKFTIDYSYVYNFEMSNISGNHVISLNYTF
jgi:hypothetical protein